MIPDELLDKLAEGINKLAPDTPPQDLQKIVRALLGSALAKLDLITREEFDAQKEVLLRTREKVDFLQQSIAKLEENGRQ